MGRAIVHLASDTSPDDVAAGIGREGAVIVDGVAPVRAARPDRVRGGRPDATPTGPDEFSGNRTRRTGSLIARSPASRDLVTHPLAVGTARTFLEHATNIELHSDPGHRHRRGGDTATDPPGPVGVRLLPSRGYQVQCNTIWALSDFTEQNGATRVVVGSNLREDKLTFGPDDTEPAEMARGRCLLIGQRRPRRRRQPLGPTRIGMNITYNVAWLRQEENQYLSVPRRSPRRYRPSCSA